MCDRDLPRYQFIRIIFKENNQQMLKRKRCSDDERWKQSSRFSKITRTAKISQWKIGRSRWTPGLFSDCPLVVVLNFLLLFFFSFFSAVYIFTVLSTSHSYYVSAFYTQFLNEVRAVRIAISPFEIENCSQLFRRKCSIQIRS